MPFVASLSLFTNYLNSLLPFRFVPPNDTYKTGIISAIAHYKQLVDICYFLSKGNLFFLSGSFKFPSTNELNWKLLSSESDDLPLGVE